VLVHCSQGVSRSAALTIGYLMWKLGRPYQEVADLVKAIRGVTNPNIGFACQVSRAPADGTACMLLLLNLPACWVRVSAQAKPGVSAPAVGAAAPRRVKVCR
jgi:Dual specificity phosphatase, catalytic domain